MSYIEELKNETKQYYQILSKEIPEFIEEYVDTPSMLRLKGISMIPGADWTNIIKLKYFNSRLDHSIGVALIIWNFTKDKKQSLAGLFHDIASPSFSHIVDCINGDYIKQESTEELTKDVIGQSKEIMELLKRDQIRLEEVCDYHKYPIADNDTPMLAADRLEYTFSDSLQIENGMDLQEIYEFYHDLTILKNEKEEIELGFKSIEKAEKFVIVAKRLWEIISQKNEFKLIMQFWTDYLKKMKNNQQIKEKDLYQISEQEFVEKIKNQRDKNMVALFEKFQESNKIGRSETQKQDVYCISIDAKKRYINPLVQIGDTVKRISEISSIADRLIQDVLNFKDSKYAYLDFPYNQELNF